MLSCDSCLALLKQARFQLSLLDIIPLIFITMAPSLVTIDSSEPLEKIIKTIERDGGVIVSNLLSPELLQECMTASELSLSTSRATNQPI